MSNEPAKRIQLLKDAAQYLTSTIVAQGVGLLRTLLMPILLGPVSLGTWNLMGVVIGYGANGHLGLLHGLNKILPGLRSTGREQERNEFKDSLWWACLALGLLSGAALFFTSFFIKHVYVTPSRIICLVLFLQMMFVFYMCLLRSDCRFDLVSFGVAALSISSTVLVLLCSFLAEDRLIGALWGLVPAHIIVLLYWHYRGGYSFKLPPRWTPIRDAFKVGFPLIVLGVIDMALLSIDRWIIAWQLPGDELGFYALAIMASSLLGLIPNAVANVFYPRMLEQFASSRSAEAVGTLLLKPVQAMAALMILVNGMAVVLLPSLIRVALPKYIPAIHLIEILLPGAYFLGLAPLAGTYIVAVDHQRGLIKIHVLAMAVGLGLDAFLLHAGYGIGGVALGTVCCYAVYGLGDLGLAIYLARRKVSETLRVLGHSIAPLIALFVALKGSSLLIPEASGWLEEVSFTACRLLLVMAALLLVIWLLSRKSGLLAATRLAMTGWRGSGNISR